MDRVRAFIASTTQDIARRSARLGARVDFDMSALDRGDAIALAPPSLRSANGAARMIRARDGWLAINLPRDDDMQSIPALLGEHDVHNGWEDIARHAGEHTCADVLERASVLGLAIAKVGETEARAQACIVETLGKSAARAPLRVVDLSALWAGPLCGSVFAAMGAEVLKLESEQRPDTTATATPALDQRLNGAKRRARISFATAEGRAAMFERASNADILITSARARALDHLGLMRARLFAANPALIWIAVTGHGWASSRVAFGDDAAASGGLVSWKDDTPHFLGDAIADPLTGLAAAAAALALIERGERGFVDASLAHTAAFIAAGRA